jgi:hypothetical protein
VVYALIDATSSYKALADDLQPWMSIHGAIMVLAGRGFGVAVIRARVLPRGTAIALMAGVVLVSLSQTLPRARRCWPPGSATSGSPAWALRCCEPVRFRAGALPRTPVGHVGDRQRPRVVGRPGRYGLPGR